jgi:hypothetical protein
LWSLLLRRRQRSQGLLNACDPRLLIGVEFPGRVEFLRQREKTPSAPPPGVLLWQSRGEQRSRQSKKAPAVQAGANRWCSNHL